MPRTWHKPCGSAFALAVHSGGSRKLFLEMLAIGTDCGWWWETPDGGGWLGLSESSADRVLSRSFRPKLRMVGGRRRQGVVWEIIEAVPAPVSLRNVENGDAEPTPNDTASRALCNSIFITSKSPLRLTGTNENLVINYEYPAWLLSKTRGDIRLMPFLFPSGSLNYISITLELERHQQKVRKIIHVCNRWKRLQRSTYKHYEFTPFCNVV